MGNDESSTEKVAQKIASDILNTRIQFQWGDQKFGVGAASCAQLMLLQFEQEVRKTGIGQYLGIIMFYLFLIPFIIWALVMLCRKPFNWYNKQTQLIKRVNKIQYKSEKANQIMDFLKDDINEIRRQLIEHKETIGRIQRDLFKEITKDF